MRILLPLTTLLLVLQVLALVNHGIHLDDSVILFKDQPLQTLDFLVDLHNLMHMLGVNDIDGSFQGGHLSLLHLHFLFDPIQQTHQRQVHFLPLLFHALLQRFLQDLDIQKLRQGRLLPRLPLLFPHQLLVVSIEVVLVMLLHVHSLWDLIRLQPSLTGGLVPQRILEINPLLGAAVPPKILIDQGNLILFQLNKGSLNDGLDLLHVQHPHLAHGHALHLIQVLDLLHFYISIVNYHQHYLD